MTISSSPSGASGDVTLDFYDAAARVYLEMAVHVWSGTVAPEDGGPLGVALSPGVDAKTRARRKARLGGTSGWAR